MPEIKSPTRDAESFYISMMNAAVELQQVFLANKVPVQGQDALCAAIDVCRTHYEELFGR